ncbi:hypothetical protein H4S01_003743 [Coemansia sp. RSA 2610]|nr:hypothetical protein H4S01_003743 [Coemansia sp. RSA 2610]
MADAQVSPTSSVSSKSGRRLRRQQSSDSLQQESMAAIRTSLYHALGSSAGKTPFAAGGSDKAAAAYLAHCYEQLARDEDSDASSNLAAEESTRSTPPALTVTAAALGRILRSGAIDEPLTYVFIFTNPRSGNQQGRSLMNMALHSFRLRDRPDVQVQIYDVTDKESLRDGLHYIHQLQLRQGDRLLKTAFPELFEEHRGIRPSPNVCAARCRRSAAKGKAADYACPAGACSGACSGSEGASSSGSANAWDDWIADATAQLQAELGQLSDDEITCRLEQAQDSAIKLHVWSAGGDGTVSSTLEALMDYGIDVGRLYFSCIPFGTGNDFADALGWGRSVPGDGVGESMRLLNKTITERLDGYTCKLDIYEVTITTYDDGHIKHVEKNMADKPGMRRYTCLMIDYFSLGVQGFVGSSFELHRPGSRSLNILMYTVAAAKWVFMKKFPPINEALESISTVPDAMLADAKLTDADRARWLETASEAERKQVLLARVAGPRKRSHGRKMTWAKEPKARRTATARDFGDGVDEDLPVIQYKPIEIDVQNVARFWGRNIDVWNSAHGEDAGGMLSNTTGVTDRATWTPQYAGDGKLELFGVRNIGDYALNQLPARKSYRISRLAQMGSPVALHFREPANYPPRSSNPLTSRKSIEQGLLYAMCDGEFIEMYHPRDIIISRKVTLKAVGRSPEASRIVLDTIKNDGLDAVQMDATAAAHKTKGGYHADISNYVASPFQRIFGSTRRMAAASSRPVPLGASGSELRVHADPSGAALDLEASRASEHSAEANSLSLRSRSSSFRQAPLRALRDSIIRTIRSSGSGSNGNGGRPNQSEPSEPSEPTSPASPTDLAEPAAAPMPTRSRTMTSSAVHHESPLRVRQSLSDMRLASVSPDSSDLVAMGQSNGAPEQKGRRQPRQPSTSTSTSSSELNDSTAEQSLAKNDSAMSSAAHVAMQAARPGNVATVGKDLVEFVEKTMTPENMVSPPASP